MSGNRHVLNAFRIASFSFWLGSRAPRAKDCADCGLAGCGLECAIGRFRDLGPPQAWRSLVDSGSARKVPHNAPPRSFGGHF
eukprot:9448522-Alexandrium_andersonii.AAC.1